MLFLRKESMSFKNNHGFTLTEVLACLVILGIVFITVTFVFRGTMATSLTQIDSISDNQIFDAARYYSMETNKQFKNGYECITIKELIDYGYLSNVSDVNRKVKITKNMQTKVIEKIEFDDKCN